MAVGGEEEGVSNEETEAELGWVAPSRVRRFLLLDDNGQYLPIEEGSVALPEYQAEHGCGQFATLIQIITGLAGLTKRTRQTAS